MKMNFSVSGMSCSACAVGIEKTVKKLDGVTYASVSLMSKRLDVEFDENVVSKKDVILTVEKLGYGITEYSDSNTKNIDKNQANALRKRFIISIIFLIPLIYFAMGKMLNLGVFEQKTNFCIQFVLAVIIIIINFKFYISGFMAVLRLSPNMDTLVALGSFASLCYSVVVTVLLFTNTIKETHAFYESSAMVLALVTLGKWLEELSKQKTGNEIDKLCRLLPRTAVILIDGEEKTVRAERVKIGDSVVLKIGDYACVDGIVISGFASIDNSAITGESLPTEAFVGSKVLSGGIVKSGKIIVEAEKVGENTLFSAIIESVKNASVSKAPVQKLADKISAYFVPIVTFIALVTFIIWAVCGKDTYLAFKYAISALVISCPCALGLATPVAIMAMAGKSASVGVLFKNAETAQKMAKVNCVVLDKTATLTVGKPKVTDFLNRSKISDERIKNVSSALEKRSNHPLAEAMLEFCGSSNQNVEDFEYVIGKGVIGAVDGEKYYLGNFFPFKNSKEFLGKTVITLSTESECLAVFGLTDVLKNDSIVAVNLLKSMNVKIVMITGDNESVASIIGGKLGISDYRANVLPNEKAQEVEKLKRSGYVTAFCGDGINDSPALATADVGVAVSTGTDIAIDTADVVITGSMLSIIDALRLSKKTVRIIKGNLFWAFFYNALFIPVASGAFAFANFTLTPTIASMLMCVSSLFVVLNALRIRSYKKIEKREKDDMNMKIKIEGMMCKHCEKKVFETLMALNGVNSVEINLKKKYALVGGNVDKEQVKSAIENVGYEVKGIE